MGEIHVHEFVSLDGVIDTPTWTFDYPGTPRWAIGYGRSPTGPRGILLGRTTFEMFAPAWSTRKVEDDEGAPFFNDTTKYVVSSSLTDPSAVWQNSTVFGPYDPDAINKLKNDVGDLYVSGSGTLVRAMLNDGLVDALHLCVFPHTRGGGPRLFPEGGPKNLERVEADAYDNGVLYLAYRPKP